MTELSRSESIGVRVLKKFVVGLLAAVSLSTSLVAVGTVPVSAEIAPYAETTWGVYDSVLSGTLTDRIDNEVFAIEQIGNTIYVAGKFTEVRQYKNSTPAAQPYLAAFSATTGAWIPSFRPNLDRPVYALQASPDGSRLFVGGEFGDVDGVANTRALVALDPILGDVDTSWRAQLKLTGRAVVYTLDLDQNWLYAGGNFTAVGGALGIPQIPVGGAVKLSLVNAAPDPNWRPIATGGGVWGIAVADNGSSVYLAGYFTQINGVSGTQGFVGVDNTTGQSIRSGRLPHNNAGRPIYQDVVTTGGLVFVAGMEHVTYVLNESDLSIRTLHSTGGTTNAGFQQGGDYQDLEVVGDRVYATCHCRNEHFADGDVFRFLLGQGGSWSRRDPIKFVAAYSATTGAYIPSFSLDISGSSGVWAVHGSSDGCLWVGGDLTRVTRANGTNQSLGGFSRHCDPNMVIDNQRPSTPTGLSVTSVGADVNLAWNASTDDVGVAGYNIMRSNVNGGIAVLVGTSATLDFVDQNLAAGEYWYYVQAVDAAGNVSWRTGYHSATIGGGSDTERPSSPRGVTLVAGNDSVLLSWDASTDNIAVTGYDIYRATQNGGPASVIGTSATETFTDSGLAAGEYWYYLRATDAAGNLSWRTGYKSATVGGPSDTQRPSTPTGFRVVNAGNDASLSWTASNDNVAVTGYNVYRAGSENGTYAVVATPSSTSHLDSGLADGTYWYYLRALDEAGNESWRTGKQTVTVGGEPADTERPSTPTGLVVGSVGIDVVSLSWNPSTDNVGVVRYVIIDDATGQVVATSSSASVDVTGLASGTAFTFYVRAEDAAGNLSWRSNKTAATTL